MHITSENGYTVYSGWSKLAPGESATLQLSYQLPNKVDWGQRTIWQWLLKSPQLASFTTVYDSQSGTSRILKHQISWPESWNLTWHDNLLSRDVGGYSLTTTLDHNLSSAVLLQK